MDHSELLRKELQIEFCKKYGPETGAELLTVIDKVLYKYTVQAQETAVATSFDNVRSICEDYLASITTNGVKKNSARNFFYVIKNFLEYTSIPINMITAKECRAYIVHLQEINKDTTVSCKANTLRRFLQWCVDEEYINRNPMAKINVKHGESSEKKPLSDTECVQMNMSCQTPREKALCEFLKSTGCRISELAKVKIEDIDFKSRTISVKRAKGGKNRVAMFGAELEIALQEYLDSRNDGNPYVFVTGKAPHHQMTTHSLREEFEKVIARSAIGRKITPHYMRHTFITNMLNKGAPINEVALLAGHASVDTTSKVYAHIAIKNLETTYNRYAG